MSSKLVRRAGCGAALMTDGDRVAVGKQLATEYYSFRWGSQPSGLGAALRLLVEVHTMEASLEHASIH